MKLIAVIAAAVAALTLTASASSAPRSNYEAVRTAVCHYFTGDLCWQAMSVVKCETGGTYSVWAGYHKHQYWGLFQMGKRERAKYGHAWNAWAQARAARKYYHDSGWYPWQCIPGGGLRW